MIEFSEKYGELTKALLAVQGAVSVVKRDATNPHYKSRYATLENVVAAVRPHCIEAGIIIMQAAGVPDNGLVPVETRIMHAESGQWLKSTIALPIVKADAQGVGSAVTYACRYSLMSLFCLPPSDDDGNAAVDGKPAKPATTTGGMTTMHKNTVDDGRQKSASQARKDGDAALLSMIDDCESAASLSALWKAQREAVEAMPKNWQNIWFERYDERRAAVSESENILAGG